MLPPIRRNLRVLWRGPGQESVWALRGRMYKTDPQPLLLACRSCLILVFVLVDAYAPFHELQMILGCDE